MVAGTPDLVQCVPSKITRKVRVINLVGVDGEVEVAGRTNAEDP